jgi:hypothetical protein
VPFELLAHRTAHGNVTELPTTHFDEQHCYQLSSSWLACPSANPRTNLHMDASETALPQQQPQPPEHQPEATCPACGGVTILLRETRRCLRCSFVICEACDAVGMDE